MPFNPETGLFEQDTATIIDSTPDGDTVKEGFEDRSQPAMTQVYNDINLLAQQGTIGMPDGVTIESINNALTAVSGTTAKKGILQLFNGINSTSTTLAATAASAKTAYDRGNAAYNRTGSVWVSATNNSSYIKFSNGIISQWGVSASGSTGTRIITLPIAFTTTTYSVVTSWQTTSNLTYQPFIHSRAKTQFVAGNNSSGYQNIPILWFAIGK